MKHPGALAKLLFILTLLVAITVHADTIYLKSGRTMHVDRVWEEDGRIMYQIGEAVASLPKSAVDRIESSSPPPPPTRADVPSSRSSRSSGPEISGPRGNRRIYFVPLGLFPASDLQELAVDCQNRFHIKVTVLPPVPVDNAAVDQERRQLISEELTAGMLRALPELARDPDAVLIGFTRLDMYPRNQDWQFAFGWRSESAAVVSTARLNLHYVGEPAAATPRIRLRKIVLKDIGILYYMLQQSDDPSSVLYSGIMGIQELDQLTEKF